LEREVRLLILDVIREHDNSVGNDLLRVIMDGAQGWQLQGHDAEDFVVGNCKGMYFAGHGTTAVTLIRCLMLLSAHPERQERARAEAVEVCQGGATLDVDALRRLKIVSVRPSVDLHPSIHPSIHPLHCI
jgi:cytochrome P450